MIPLRSSGHAAQLLRSAPRRRLLIRIAWKTTVRASSPAVVVGRGRGLASRSTAGQPAGHDSADAVGSMLEQGVSSAAAPLAAVSRVAEDMAEAQAQATAHSAASGSGKQSGSRSSAQLLHEQDVAAGMTHASMAVGSWSQAPTQGMGGSDVFRDSPPRSRPGDLLGRASARIENPAGATQGAATGDAPVREFGRGAGGGGGGGGDGAFTGSGPDPRLVMDADPRYHSSFPLTDHQRAPLSPAGVFDLDAVSRAVRTAAGAVSNSLQLAATMGATLFDVVSAPLTGRGPSTRVPPPTGTFTSSSSSSTRRANWPAAARASGSGGLGSGDPDIDPAAAAAMSSPGRGPMDVMGEKQSHPITGAGTHPGTGRGGGRETYARVATPRGYGLHLKQEAGAGGGGTSTPSSTAFTSHAGATAPGAPKTSGTGVTTSAGSSGALPSGTDDASGSAILYGGSAFTGNNAPVGGGGGGVR